MFCLRIFLISEYYTVTILEVNYILILIFNNIHKCFYNMAYSVKKIINKQKKRYCNFFSVNST
ncbi:hypothetical protein BAZSYMA_ACONTIG170705_0 [Bathymodiolus azoricus thioautotrophic gill symbiont]|uniref:Uncharacterized protein n=1 Tax=Bathymodiolus azoricus thioautotrophic gill symbiont TaxID=235205 RepID=A0A1H6LYS5_9GAMM|nr:hypothetical protein BAZSYMA_ACONTIG170705_0 [Bathymodiolus azoricus thioautotrophic gill symbiont]